MTVTIRPAPLRGRIKAPPSKSMAHRLLICGGLSEGGETRIRGISDSEDVSATLDCLSVLGAKAAARFAFFCRSVFCRAERRFCTAHLRCFPVLFRSMKRSAASRVFCSVPRQGVSAWAAGFRPGNTGSPAISAVSSSAAYCSLYRFFRVTVRFRFCRRWKAGPICCLRWRRYTGLACGPTSGMSERFSYRAASSICQPMLK